MEQIKKQYTKNKRLNVAIYWNNTKMINYDYITEEIIKDYNPIWSSQIPDHPYKIIIIMQTRDSVWLN